MSTLQRYAIFGLTALACLSLKAAPVELTGVRYAGYTTNAVPAGFSILAVPFGGFDTSNFITNNISLEALISTNGLSIDDRLIVFDETTTNYWYYSLTATGWTNLQVTALGEGVSTNHVVNAPLLSSATKAQGYAFWLRTTNATIAQLQGIVNTNVAGIAIAANSFTLIGNALPGDLNLNDPSFTNANPWFAVGPTGFGDEIHVVSGGAYLKNVFVGNRWKLVQQTPSNTVYEVDSASIPAGSGVWFKRVGNNQTFILK